MQAQFPHARTPTFGSVPQPLSDEDYLAYVQELVYNEKLTPLPRAKWQSDAAYAETLLDQLDEEDTE